MQFSDCVLDLKAYDAADCFSQALKQIYFGRCKFAPPEDQEHKFVLPEILWLNGVESINQQKS